MSIRNVCNLISNQRNANSRTLSILILHLLVGQNEVAGEVGSKGNSPAPCGQREDAGPLKINLALSCKAEHAHAA